MQVPMDRAVTVSPLSPAAVEQNLPMAMAALQNTADPPLELMCSITSALRLYPHTSTAPGLNPYHVALTDVTVSSAALQGHIARAAAGDTSPELQQAMVYDAMSWPMFQTDMMANWDLYRRYAGGALGPLGPKVDAWNRQISQGYRESLQAIRSAIGPEQFRALVPTIWAPMGMNRF